MCASFVGSRSDDGSATTGPQRRVRDGSSRESTAGLDQSGRGQSVVAVCRPRVVRSETTDV
ncbi:hypothetical protein DJ82_08295 [Halorubrum sp. Ib24]|nr:hypothetical protein DJ82_08295 [Halorubrum sp. Ib24]OYR51478.1 hypothetical protein DJ73_13155 [Halorubrum sp. Ea1]